MEDPHRQTYTFPYAFDYTLKPFNAADLNAELG